MPPKGPRIADRPLGSRFAAAGESPGLLLWRVTNRWQAAMRAALAPHGLTHVQYVLLASLVWLDAHDADLATSQKDLAEHASTDVMMTSQVLRALEAKGLVERARHPNDRRARVLHATPAGTALARSATAAVEAADARFFAALGDPGGFTRGLQQLSARRDASRTRA